MSEDFEVSEQAAIDAEAGFNEDDGASIEVVDDRDEPGGKEVSEEARPERDDQPGPGKTEKDSPSEEPVKEDEPQSEEPKKEEPKDEAALPFVPQYDVPNIEELQRKLSEQEIAAKEKFDDLKARFEDGELSPNEYQDIRDTIKDSLAEAKLELRMASERARLNEESQKQAHAFQEQLFFDQNPDYFREDPATKRKVAQPLFGMLDFTVGVVRQEEQFKNAPWINILRESQRRMDAELSALPRISSLVEARVKEEMAKLEIQGHDKKMAEKKERSDKIHTETLRGKPAQRKETKPDENDAEAAFNED